MDGSRLSIDFAGKKWSERGDLNSRPPVPQTGALTELRYAPTLKIKHLLVRVRPKWYRIGTGVIMLLPNWYTLQTPTRKQYPIFGRVGSTRFDASSLERLSELGICEGSGAF